jgi:hypothetical protein
VVIHNRSPSEVRIRPRWPQHGEHGRREGPLPTDHGPTRCRHPLPTFSRPPPRRSRSPPQERIRLRWPRSGEQGGRDRGHHATLGALELDRPDRRPPCISCRSPVPPPSTRSRAGSRHRVLEVLGVGQDGGFHDAGCRIGLPPSHPPSLSLISQFWLSYSLFPFQIRQVYWGELATDMAEGLAHGHDTSAACSTSSTTPLISPAPPPSHAPGANSVRSLLIPICFLTRLPPIRGLVAELHA